MAEENQTKTENKMREMKIEKMIIRCGALGAELEKGAKLLEMISEMKAYKTKAKKRIPTFGIRPDLEIGCIVTIRNQNKIKDLLKRFLEVKDNKLKKKQIADNHFSFGIEEYFEIQEVEYNRDIGIMGLEVTIVFSRKGLRVKRKKIKKGKVPKKQIITKEEIIQFMKENYNLEVEGR